MFAEMHTVWLLFAVFSSTGECQLAVSIDSIPSLSGVVITGSEHRSAISRESCRPQEKTMAGACQRCSPQQQHLKS
jgi:hypothetical protein